MKLTILQSDLYDALSVTGRAIGAKPLMPILEYYRLQIGLKSLVVTGGNMEVFISKNVPCQADTEQDIALPSARLIGLIRELPEQSLEITADGKAVTIISTSGKYLIPYELGENYPEISIDEPVYFEADLSSVQAKVLFAASSNSATPFFGISCEIRPETVTFTGCDRSNLSSLSIPIKSDITKDILIRPDTIRALLPGLCKVGVTTNNITLEYEDVIIKSVLMTDIYPDWHAISPSNEKTVIVNRDALCGALRRTNQFSNLDKTVMITVGGDEMKLRSVNLMSEAANESMPIKSDSEVEIAVNGAMLLECVSKLTEQNAVIKFTDGKTALTIQEKNHFMLSMPQIIQG